MADVGDGDGLGQDIARVGRALAQVVAPTTILASVLMYFGSVRLNSMYSRLGVNTSMLSFTFQEYVMRSINVADEPLVVVLLLLLLLLLVAPFARAVLIRSTVWHRIATMRTIWALATLGVVSIAVAVMAIADWPRCWDRPFYVKPLFLGLGSLLLFYSAYLRNAVNSGPAVPPTGQIVQRTVLAALALVSVLWFVDEHAQRIGKEDADRILAQPEKTLVAAVVYARQRLNLEGPGIDESLLPDPNADFRYRYTGLRFLIASNRQYFLVPVCWGSTPGARTIALPADGSIRLETLNVMTKQSCSKGH
ncbi:hypothetical protein ACWDRB_23430 [Nonomuraea sp. NPDC003707]